MTVRQRILALRLLQKQDLNPTYANRIGITVKLRKKDPEERKEHHV